MNIEDRSLNDIYAEAYSIRNNINKEDIKFNSERYKNYVSEERKKINQICKSMGINLSCYKDKDKDKYKIPFDVAKAMVMYLTEDSGKGSFVSKIRNNKLSDISNDEKRSFINKVFDNLFNVCNGDLDFEVIKELKEDYIGTIDILDKVDAQKQNLYNLCNESINRNIDNIYNVSSISGLVRFGIENKNISNSKYSNIIDEKDRMILVDSYILMIKGLTRKWDELVKKYIEEKKDCLFGCSDEDIEKLIDVELCLLKDTLDVMYRSKDELDISKEQLESIKSFLTKYKDVKDNRVLEGLNNITKKNG